jgi:hypothetical protein
LIVLKENATNCRRQVKAYDVLVKSPEDRKRLERTAPLLVAVRDRLAGKFTAEVCQQAEMLLTS